MASLTIKNIPDHLYEQLKLAANTHHRSINSELIHCLEKALLPTKLSSSDIKSAAQLLRQKVKAECIDLEEIDAAKFEGRP